MASVSGEQPRGHHDAGWDTPTPPAGLPVSVAGENDPTPPTGIPKLSEVVTAEDYGRPAPMVLGGTEAMESHDDAGEWPTLEYRSRARAQQRPTGRDWLGRRRDSE